MNTIALEIDAGVALITFTRPEVRNAMSLEMIEELTEVLERLRFDESVKVLVFTGSGEQAFMAGGDLTQFLSVSGKTKAYPLLRRAGNLLQLIDEYPKPTVAMINGIVLGGGCEFAISCDFRFSSDRAVIGFVQIGMHITTGWGGGSRLFRKIGSANALQLLLTGDKLTADKAKELGYVNEVFTHDRLKEEVLAFCRRIASHDTTAIQAFMDLARLYENGTALSLSIEKEIERCSELWGSPAHYGVVRKYIEKNEK